MAYQDKELKRKHRQGEGTSKGFKGTYRRKIDSDYVKLPEKYLRIIKSKSGNKMMLTRFQGGCLHAMTLPDFDRSVKILSKGGKVMRYFGRLYLGDAKEISITREGLFQIPLPLKQYAHIRKEVVLQGRGNHFEVYSHETWQKQSSKKGSIEEVLWLLIRDYFLL